MRLVAIFCVWSDWDLLKYSLKNIRPLVDGVIIVASERSNYGEISPVPDWPDIYIREPQFRDARSSETDKRNFGLNIARQQGYTHFLSLDCDELYVPEEFLREKEKFLNKNLKGLVCQCQVYFKSPRLTLGLDTTLVPFIHELTPTILHEFNRSYPFAWIDGKIRIDPTRSMNINSGVERTDLIMHHFSYVRLDIEQKIRNSTAKSNLERSTIFNDLVEAKEGYFVEFYQRHLQRSSVDFGISEYTNEKY
jgi:glycosyltransferase involved in cell wall biosynthesis